MQLLVLAEDFLDDHVERPGVRSLCVPDQAAQALEILRGIAQAVDVIEPQALQLAFGDQLLAPADGWRRRCRHPRPAIPPAY